MKKRYYEEYVPSMPPDQGYSWLIINPRWAAPFIYLWHKITRIHKVRTGTYESVNYHLDIYQKFRMFWVGWWCGLGTIIFAEFMVWYLTGYDPNHIAPVGQFIPFATIVAIIGSM